MIERYQTKEMASLWTQESRFQFMLEVEKAVAKAQADLGLIPQQAAEAILKHAGFEVSDILERENITQHDVIAFVECVAARVGPWGRYLHWGLTSSDVLDTALSLQLRAAFDLLIQDVCELAAVLRRKITEHRGLICIGRTHGIWAEPTTYAIKWAGFYAELVRNINRLKQARQQVLVCKLSGAVGTYSNQNPEVEALVAERLSLPIEAVATQVVPRDRLADCYWSLAMLLTGYERLAVELRHLQRSEVAEVLEFFQTNQKGSSAMPHKQNPISAENLTGMARMLRSYIHAGMENIVLWHERDISHSSVERVFLPDAFILAHYATLRLQRLMSHLVVDEQRVRANLAASLGLTCSSRLLVKLVDKSWSRERAYAKIQALSFQAKKAGTHLRELVLKDEELTAVFSQQDIAEVFAQEACIEHEALIIERVLQLTV